MDEYQSLGPAAFRVKWSKNGVKCSATNILQGLKRERQQRDNMVANQARAEYSGVNFGIQFTYMKAGKSGICTRDSAIANRYRLLKQYGAA
jgi:hypothetical protein